MRMLEVGELAPDFTTTDVWGAEVSLAAYRGRRHVILVFNRGLG